MFWYRRSFDCIWGCNIQGLRLVCNVFSHTLRNVLFDSGFQVPRCLTNIAVWATAFKRVYHATFMIVGYVVFTFWIQNRSWCKYYYWCKCPVLLILPYVGVKSTQIERNIKKMTEKLYRASNPRVIFTSASVLNPKGKDHISHKRKSCVVYTFKCCWLNSYIC